MKHVLRKGRNLLAACLLILGPHAVKAQCITVTAVPDVTVAAATGSCGAIVNFGTPTVTSVCNYSLSTFNYTGAIETWTVPSGVTALTITARGAQGGYNTSSGTGSGLGAEMKGVFAVTPGQVLKVLVGEQPSASSGNGGGGGTFVTDILNNPLIVAGGGGGSSQTTDSPSKHGQITTTGGTGAAGGGNGGASGNGGSIGAAGFQAGAGGGLLTNGADGWTSGTGGSAFVNGGAGAPTNAPARGGFGGGGSGSSYVVGGGGGGYSGGGSGGNSTAGVGGGGGSFNGGTSQVNTAGVNAGHGQVLLEYLNPYTYTATQTAGLSSGSAFPVGTTVQTFSITDSQNNSLSSTFSVTVLDTQTPTITCPASTASCVSAISAIGPVAVLDNCAAPAVTYTFSGASSGSGSANASGTSFNLGVTTVTYTAQDNAGNKGTCSFSVTVNPVPVVTASSNSAAICNGQAASLTAGGANTYSWTGIGSGAVITVTPSSTTSYTVTGTTLAGCSNTFAIQQTVNQNPTVTAASSASAICQGQVASLTAGGANTYSWSGIGSGAVIQVTPGITTTYTVQGTNTAGCTHSVQFTQLVNPNPTVSAITNFTAICSGEAATLTASGADTYSWVPGGSGSVIAVSPASTTAYTVTGTDLAGCTGTFALTQQVNATPTISAASNFSAICVGQSATLTASGADTYSWSAGSATNTQVVSPAANAVYTVTGTSLAGCSATLTVTQVVNPNPVVTASSSSSAICLGQSATLTAAGADSYAWTSGSTTSVSVITPLSNTGYTVTGTTLAGCSATTAIIQVVNANPTVNIAAQESICLGESASLTANGAASYLWSNTQTTSVIMAAPLATEVYTVQGTDANGCSASAAFTLTVMECTGISKQAAAAGAVSIYPNPTTGEISLDLGNGGTRATVEIRNTLGQLIHTTEIRSSGKISLEDMANGLYYIKIKDEAGMEITQRILKQN